MTSPDQSGETNESLKSLRVGLVTTSFPVASNPCAGIFVKCLVERFPVGVRAIVLMPCVQSTTIVDPNARYDIECFTYGPRRWMRLAHHPGGIPDALRRRDPAILLLPLLIPAMFLACLRLARRVDVIHGNWSAPGLIAAIAAKIRGRPAIVTLRGEDVTRSESSVLYSMILRACMAMNCRTVVVSQSMCATLRGRFPSHAKEIEFVPNGVSINLPGRRQQFHVPLRLVTVSSLIRRKRVTTLIRALTYPGGASTAVLRIVGDGPERKALESMAIELGVANRVEFVGGVSPDQVEGHLAWGDMFVFASESEGRPNAILESMATGLPTIATDIPGVRELLYPDRGMLFPVGDAARLAQCIDELATDPAIAKGIANSALAAIRDNGLTWASTAERYSKLYQDLVSPSVDI